VTQLCAIPPPSAHPTLSGRQLQLLELLADGLTLPQIARQMWVTLPTAKKHKAILFEKLNARTSAQAVAEGFRRGHLVVEQVEQPAAVA